MRTIWVLLLLGCGEVSTRSLPVDDEPESDGGPRIEVNGDLELRIEVLDEPDAGDLEDAAPADAGAEEDAGDELNACGGTGVLYREPGVGCEGPSGPCAWGSWECTGPDTVDCIACDPCEVCGS